DIRLRGGLPADSSPATVGALAAAGDLALNAARVYPTTLTSFAITDSSDTGTISIGRTGTTTDPPLSVGGALTLSAANISVDGSILAPFGSIGLNATDTLALNSGSVVSVSGDDAVFLYGQIQNGVWIYPTITNPANPLPTIP